MYQEGGSFFFCRLYRKCYFEPLKINRVQGHSIKMDTQTRNLIKNIVKTKIKEKLKKYESETEHKPFFEAIFDKSVILQASIMQSLYTTFGMSIYEQILVELAKQNGFKFAERQFQLEGCISENTELLINKLCNQDIGTQTKSNELQMIRDISVKGRAQKHSDQTVDVFLEDNNGNELYIDITTVKPNKKEARALRRKMLVWAALKFSQNKNANIRTCIGLPYNPYHPKPYERGFVLGNCHRDELLIQEELWNCTSSNNDYQELLQIFGEVGSELKKNITNFIAEESAEYR